MTFSARQVPLRHAPWASRARADFAAARSVRLSSARRARARRLGAIYRSLSPVDRAFSDRAHPHGAVLELAGKKAPLPPSALFGRFRIGAGNVEQLGRRNAWMVPGAEWRIFGTAGHAAHVGRSIRCGRLLAVLDVARTLPRSAFRFHLYALGCWPPLGLVSWTGYRGGQLSQGENHLTEQMPAGLRKADRASAPRLNTSGSDPAYFYGAHVEPIFVEPLLLLPWSG